METELWWAGNNEEWFDQGPFDSREQAITLGRSDWGDGHFFIGKQGSYTPFSRDFIEELLKLEACDVDDECGSDASDNWPPHINHAARAEANKKIAAILMELCGECSVFTIEGSERIEPAPSGTGTEVKAGE
jgi:hypothetical protein